MVYTEHVYTFSAVGAAFTKKHKALNQRISGNISVNISHLEYSRGARASHRSGYILTRVMGNYRDRQCRNTRWIMTSFFEIKTKIVHL